jgi:hypothetical protein
MRKFETHSESYVFKHMAQAIMLACLFTTPHSK